MNNKRWDGAPPMNSKEQISRNRVAGCGGFDNPFSATYIDNSLKNPYSFESLKLRSKIAFTLKHDLALKRRVSVWSQSKASSILQVGSPHPKDMRDSLTRARDAMQDRFKPSHHPSKKQTAVVRKPPTLYDALSTMVSSIGATLDLVDFLGHASTKAGLRVALPKLMGGMGITAGAFGIYDNIKQMYVDGLNWNDAAQVVTQGVLVGMALFVTVTGSTVLVPIVAIGGVTLFAWELAESHFGW